MSNKIRLASTVLLLRSVGGGADKKYQVYTIRRPDTMKFLPGYTAFPGGALEDQDYFPEWNEYLIDATRVYGLLPPQRPDKERGEPEESMPTTDRLSSLRVHKIAAIREVFEETGILICVHSDNGPAIRSSLVDMRVQTCRNALIQGEISFLEMIRELGVKLDAKRLVHVGKRLTPPSKPIRFDTQFFLICIPPDVELSPLPGEVAGDEWLEPGEAIKRVRQQKMLCAPPTIECFSRLQEELGRGDFLKQLHI
jgi:8-oxo-dGTP pyrophosphatase MutT (NUDIX family)